MLTIISVNSVPIRITDERLKHITERHPELKNQRDKIIETIKNPDFILKGDFNELLAVKFYEDTPLTRKYLIVVYKEINRKDGFVITAYFTSRPLIRREKVWPP